MLAHRADDGGKKARLTEESAKKTVNHRAGNAGSFRPTCGDFARVLLRFAREAAGAAEHPAFPAPSLSRVVVGKPWRRMRRGIKDLWPRTRKSNCSNRNICRRS